ncbi:hypothetical protein N7516_007935 [Penicillium verrucosum]|uniref:uncharacterized protein n=1 Tax=Penicillium verrucosum TaxID=60171 RepID=UPI002544EFE4|nr:uncharacterized protein N7516_007935 [Penicillium verrucosum]KAJ5926162.1 hypothetical protein N7516_007935 [Penicillium verrucosum]
MAQRRNTYPHIRISSKEVIWEAATIPRGILKMQDKTCLGRVQGLLTFDTRQDVNREREQDGSGWSYGRQGVLPR